MKKGNLLTTLILSFVMFFATDMKAQNDGFFSQQSGETRNQTSDATRVGTFNITTDNSGVGIQDFAEDTSLSGGLLALTATGIVYLIGKRRKENE